jgi:hypothetical protein
MIRALVDSDAVESASALPRVRAIVQRARGISVAGATRCPQETRSVSENGRSVKFASPDPANPAYPRNVVPTRNSISTGTRQRSIVQDHGQQHTQAVRARPMDRRSPVGVNKILAALRGVPKEAWRLGQMGSVSAVVSADADRLADVTGVGSGVASSIFRAVGTEPPPEPASGCSGRDWQTGPWRRRQASS